MNYLKLGKVAFQDAGVYDAERSYERYQFVTTEDSCFLSRKDGNVGHEVTDTEWWSCLANGQPATNAARGAKAATADLVKKVEDTLNDFGSAEVYWKTLEQDRETAEQARAAAEQQRQEAAAIGRYSIDFGTDAATATVLNMETCRVEITAVQTVNCDTVTLNEETPVGKVIPAGSPMVWDIKRQTDGLEAAIGVTYKRINDEDTIS